MTPNQQTKPAAMSMQLLIKNATTIIDGLAAKPRTSRFMQECSGILIMSATEYALALSGQHGTGVLMKHVKESNQWSNPSATRIRGIGLGIQMGSSSKSIIMFLSDHELSTLTDTAILRFGIQSSFYIASLEADTYVMVSDIFNAGGRSDCNKIQGTKTGLSLQGAAITPMWNVNRDFYGDLYYPNVVKPVPKKILEGKVKREASVEDRQLIHALHSSLNTAIMRGREVKKPRCEVNDTVDVSATATAVA